MLWAAFSKKNQATRNELVEVLGAELYRDPRSWVRCLPFILKITATDLLNRLNRGRFRAEVIDLGEFSVVRISHIPPGSDRKRKPLHGEFALFKLTTSIWCICSCVRSAVFHSCAVGAVQYVSPGTSLIFTSTQEMRSIFDGWSQEKMTIDVLRHSEYNRNESTIKFLRRRKNYKAVFAEVEEKNAVLRSVVGVAMGERRKLIAEFYMSNNGLLGLRRGNLSFLVDRAVGEVAKIGTVRDLLFSNRERTRAEFHPLRLDFKARVLGEKGQNLEFIRAVTSIKKAGVGVLHANPYLHLIFTDFTDGSSFSVYSASPTTVDVVPSVKSSVSSLMRLYRGISERFRDCLIAEAPPERYTLRDFLE